MEKNEFGMRFVVDDDNVFPVEDHPVANTNCRCSTRNNRACEFVTFSNGRHVFVEAKSSVPRVPKNKVEDLRLNGEPMPENWCAFDNYTNYLREVSQKFIDSYYIMHAIFSGRHGEEVKENIKLAGRFPDNGNVEFVLIINIPDDAGNVRLDVVSQLKEALTNEMRPFLKTWNFSTTAVKVFWPGAAQSCYGFLPDFA